MLFGQDHAAKRVGGGPYAAAAPPGKRRMDAGTTGRGADVKELLRTNDIVLVSFVRALLDEAEIPYLVLDSHMSVVEGSLGVLPRRVLVGEDRMTAARRLMAENGLRHEVRDDGR